METSSFTQNQAQSNVFLFKFYFLLSKIVFSMCYFSMTLFIFFMIYYIILKSWFVIQSNMKEKLIL